MKKKEKKGGMGSLMVIVLCAMILTSLGAATYFFPAYTRVDAITNFVSGGSGGDCDIAQETTCQPDSFIQEKTHIGHIYKGAYNKINCEVPGPEFEPTFEIDGDWKTTRWSLESHQWEHVLQVSTDLAPTFDDHFFLAWNVQELDSGAAVFTFEITETSGPAYIVHWSLELQTSGGTWERLLEIQDNEITIGSSDIELEAGAYELRIWTQAFGYWPEPPEEQEQWLPEDLVQQFAVTWKEWYVPVSE